MQNFNITHGDLVKDCFTGLIQGHVIHGMNAQGVMRAGIAKQFRDRFPSVYKLYMQTQKRYGLHLGMAIPVRISNSLVIWNLITQQDYGRNKKRYVSYDAIDDALARMESIIPELMPDVPTNLYFPYIGCDLAQGKWSTVSTLINDRLVGFNKTLYEYSEILSD